MMAAFTTALLNASSAIQRDAGHPFHRGQNLRSRRRHGHPTIPAWPWFKEMRGNGNHNGYQTASPSSAIRIDQRLGYGYGSLVAAVIIPSSRLRTSGGIVMVSLGRAISATLSRRCQHRLMNASCLSMRRLQHVCREILDELKVGGRLCVSTRDGDRRSTS